MKKHIFTFISSLLVSTTVMAQSWTIQKTPISTTLYDLQSNGGCGRKIIQATNGEASAIWTSSQLAPPYNDRKISYSHYTPSTGWQEQNTNTTGATARKGFATISVNTNNEELLMSHAFGTTSFTSILQKSTGFGKGGWKESKPIVNNIGVSGVNAGWHKTAASGNTIYVIAMSIDEASNGMTDPIYFSKSTDGGGTFSNFNLLPGEDTINFPANYSNTENYCIDAFDKYVVIVGSGLFTDLTMWKSDDYGATFKRSIIEKFPIHGWAKKNFPISDVNKDGKVDTLAATDGVMDVVLDLQGNAHLFYNRRYYVQDKDTGYASVQFLYPESPMQQVIYWNELTKTNKPIAGALDLNKDGKITKSSNTDCYNDYRMGFAGKPTTGIDKNGVIYMAYMSYNEGDTTVIDFSQVTGKFFHNIYVMSSADQGKTWSPPVNITQTSLTENAFPSMARYVGDHLLIVYQEDSEPGTTGGSGTPQTDNRIVIADLSKKTTGVDLVSLDTAPLMSIYPNPTTTGTFSINLTSTENTVAKISICNMLGQNIFEEQATINKGSTLLTINSNSLVLGMYFINLSTANGSILTQKLLVNP